MSNIKKIFCSPLLYLNLLLPTICFADVKQDIIAYELPFENGDYIEAIKLANIALENLKKETNPNKAYFAKINFDLAYFNSLSGNFKASLSPCIELLSILEANPEIKKTTDMNEINLIYGLAQYGNANTKKETKEAIAYLEKAIAPIENIIRYDDFLVQAYIRLANFAAESGNWSKMGDYSNKIINSTISTFKKKDEIRDKYLLIGYFSRAQATLIQGYKNSQFINISTGTHILEQNNSKVEARYWSDALTDIRIAKKIYGKKKSKIDKTFATLDAWEGVLIAYGLTASSQETVEKFSNKINEKIGYSKFNSYSDEEALNTICNNAFKYNYDVGFPSFAETKFHFASTVVAYDIGPNDLPTNVRILASIPDEMFADEVKNGVAKAKLLKKESNIPKECYKDRTINFKFVVK